MNHTEHELCYERLNYLALTLHERAQYAITGNWEPWRKVETRAPQYAYMADHMNTIRTAVFAMLQSFVNPFYDKMLEAVYFRDDGGNFVTKDFVQTPNYKLNAKNIFELVECESLRTDIVRGTVITVEKFNAFYSACMNVLNLMTYPVTETVDFNWSFTVLPVYARTTKRLANANCRISDMTVVKDWSGLSGLWQQDLTWGPDQVFKTPLEAADSVQTRYNEARADMQTIVGEYSVSWYDSSDDKGDFIYTSYSDYGVQYYHSVRWNGSSQIYCIETTLTDFYVDVLVDISKDKKLEPLRQNENFQFPMQELLKFSVEYTYQVENNHISWSDTKNTRPPIDGYENLFIEKHTETEFENPFETYGKSVRWSGKLYNFDKGMDASFPGASYEFYYEYTDSYRYADYTTEHDLPNLGRPAFKVYCVLSDAIKGRNTYFRKMDYKYT